AVRGQPSRVARLRDGDEQLLVLLVLQIRGVDLRRSFDGAPQDEASVGAGLQCALGGEQLQGAADRSTRYAELPAQVLLHQMVAGTGALLLEQMQNASGQLRLQAARGGGSTRGGSLSDRAGAFPTHLHDLSPQHNLCRAAIVYLLGMRRGRPAPAPRHPPPRSWYFRNYKITIIFFEIIIH